MPSLVIVESAAKAKTIQGYLNSAAARNALGSLTPFTVLASYGHVWDLPANGLGIDLDTWALTYVPVAKKADNVVGKIVAAARKSDAVFLAADMDREGAAIAFHLQEILRRELGARTVRTERIVFQEITPKALVHAVLHPVSLDMGLVHAQEARRILDRVVGFQLSPLLWRRFATSTLSAGRVQSAALQMVVERHREAEAFVPVPTWTLEGRFRVAGSGASAAVTAICAAAWEGHDQEAPLRAAMERMMEPGRTWTATFAERTAKRNPPPPFTTSTLQQEAYTRLGLPAKRCMQLAQGLYEAGFITYMRTDATTLSEDARGAIVAWVCENHGEEETEPRTYATRNAHAQEAHEAIRPTHVARLDVSEDTSPAHQRLYDLIWRRAVATQMAAAVYREVHVTLRPQAAGAEGGGDPGEVFQGKVRVLVSPGYLRVAKTHRDDGDSMEEGGGDGGGEDTSGRARRVWERLLARGTVTMELTRLHAKGDATRPPALFHEPTLVKAMEREGIGRPSTYASILDKLFDRAYVVKGSAPAKSVRVVHITAEGRPAAALETEEAVLHLGGREADRMVPTSLGVRVADYLRGIVPFLLDTGFTANMESSLDAIATKERTKKDVLDAFYASLRPAVAQATEEQRAHAQQKAAVGATAEGGGAKATGKGAKAPELAPRDVEREFPGQTCQLVRTRFGPALYHTEQRRFVSVAPFLAWRKTTAEEITEADAAFLMTLPQTRGDVEVHLGRYGLYLKRGADNYKLPRGLWDAVYDGSATGEELAAAAVAVKKKPRGEGRAGPRGGRRGSP